MRHFDLNPQQSGDGAHQALSLTQRLLENHTQRQAQLNCQVRIDSLAARRRSGCRRPQSASLFTYPNGQIAAHTQAFVVRGAVGHPTFLLRDLVATISVEFVRHL
jgi:hypothetical protein